MRAVVSYKKKKSRKKVAKTLYMRFKDKRSINSFIKRASKLGFEIKVFTHLGW